MRYALCAMLVNTLLLMPGTKYLYDFLRGKEGVKKKDLTP